MPKNSSEARRIQAIADPLQRIYAAKQTTRTPTSRLAGAVIDALPSAVVRAILKTQNQPRKEQS